MSCGAILAKLCAAQDASRELSLPTPVHNQLEAALQFSSSSSGAILSMLYHTMQKDMWHRDEALVDALQSPVSLATTTSDWLPLPPFTIVSVLLVLSLLNIACHVTVDGMALRSLLVKGKAPETQCDPEFSSRYCPALVSLSLLSFMFVIDPVARFHLRNGATLHRINWMSNVAPEAMASSCGECV